MSLTDVAIDQRQKEEQTFRSSLALYLIGSLVLHAGFLAYAMTQPLQKLWSPPEEPIEIVLVEPPTPAVDEPEDEPELEPEPLAELTTEPSQVEENAAALPDDLQATAPLPAASLSQPRPDLPPEPEQPQPNSMASETALPPLAQPPGEPQQAPASQPLVNSSANEPQTSPIPASPTPAATTIPGSLGPSNIPVSPLNIGTGMRPASPNSNSGNPQPTDSKPRGTTNRGNGRVACRQCSKPQYPRNLLEKGIEGKPQISIDVDSKGRVINARVIKSSGHPELDAAAIRAVQGWRFTSSDNGRQGITASVDFMIEGSERERQARERNKTPQATSPTAPKPQLPPAQPAQAPIPPTGPTAVSQPTFEEVRPSPSSAPSPLLNEPPPAPAPPPVEATVPTAERVPPPEPAPLPAPTVQAAPVPPPPEPAPAPTVEENPPATQPLGN